MDKLQKNLLMECSLFSGINHNDLDRIINITSAMPKSYQKGDTIIGKTDGRGRIGIVTKGKITEHKYHIDGSSQLMKIYSRSDILGLNEAASMMTGSPNTYTAYTDCTVVFLWYRNLVDSSYLNGDLRLAVLRNISRILAEENIRSVHTIDILSHYTIRERIKAFLNIQQEMHKSTVFDISMNQVQLAQYLRVNRSVLSRELNIMRKEGLIDFKGSVYTVLY